ncbi:MAG: radical SAM protein [Oscillibacter sp.]|nr:radical SAM protein [Oscillibacter sp.]
MKCNLCPRNCGALRTERDGGGACGMPWAPIVAKRMLHRWEEPCLTGENGAGAVFFTGCALRCAYCQNRAISRPDAEARAGSKAVGVAELRGMFRELIGRGAACLDLVTPSHFAPLVREALRGEEWPVPVVWNSSGYEKVETLRPLEGLVQIYLPDMKYALPDLAEAYSGAADYFQWAAPAIEEMFRQTGPYRMENGKLLSGVLIRHLMLPGELENTRRVIDWFSRTFRPGDALFSLMRQYTPQPGAAGKLSRRVTGAEYRAAVAYMQNCGVADGYTQDAASAADGYTPDF